MEADFAVELGAEDETLELPWAAEGGPRYFDLKRQPELLLEIDEALTRLAEVSPRLARVVECRFYGGLSEEEIAEVLGVTVRTVERDWTKARLLLRRALAS